MNFFAIMEPYRGHNKERENVNMWALISKDLIFPHFILLVLNYLFLKKKNCKNNRRKRKLVAPSHFQKTRVVMNGFFC